MKTLKLLAPELNDNQLKMIERELLKVLPTDDIVTTKYGYNSREKKYGFRIGILEATEAIKQFIGGKD